MQEQPHLLQYQHSLIFDFSGSSHGIRLELIQLTPQQFDLCRIGLAQGFVRHDHIHRTFVASASIFEPIRKAQDGLFESGIRGLEFFLKGYSVDRFSAIGYAEARFFQLVL